MSSTSLTDMEPGHASGFLAGARRSVPIMLATMPFGLLFGALAVQNGLTVGEAMLMSASILGGASQLVGIELFGQRIAPWVIVLSIFAVNFRHVLYSAAVGRHIRHWTPWQRAVGFFFLTDPQFAESERRGESGRKVGFAWYLGLALPVYVCWIAEAGIGAAFGNLIPDPHALGLDFLLPIYFLGLVMDFRLRPHWLSVVSTSAVASIVAFHFVGSPWHISLGAVFGVALAALLAGGKPSDGKAERKA